jgi:VWFA-related protein
MRKTLAFFLATAILSVGATQGQTTPQPSQPTQQGDEEVIRVTSELVQTSVVVTDKNDQIVSDLKKDDFEVYENGKRQDVKFMEFVGINGERRAEGATNGASLPESARIERELSAKDVGRVVAFVIDDLTIPYADMATVRQTLRDFVDNKMQEGDLVAIIRTVGGKGLLEQFTSDKQLLRRAIAQLNVTTSPFASFNNDLSFNNEANAAAREIAGEATSGPGSVNMADIGTESISNAYDESVRLTRGLLALSTANRVIDGLREIPGRKSLVLLSAGLPLFGPSVGSESVGIGGGANIKAPNIQSGLYLNTSMLLRLVSDNAVRSGVVINTMDPRGLNASPGVRGFQDTPAKSALLGGDPNFGHGGSETDVFGLPLAGGEEHLSLRALSNATGGVTVTNTNDFKEGLDKVLARSRGYYVLAYTPSEKFDNKFRKLDVKVKRDGVRLYKYSGYLARDEKRADGARTKEQMIVAAARSPLAKRDLDVSSNLSLRMIPPRGASIGVDLLIDPKTLNFTQSGGKYHATFDVVGFVLDELGKTRGGFSETVNVNLTPEEYEAALKTGLTYSAETQLPSGYYQLRAVVREEGSGNLGTVSRYIEVPDLTKGRLTMSSIFLHSVDPSAGNAGKPVALTGLRQVSRKDDLRYSAIVYNAKLDKGQPQFSTQLIISRDNRIIFKQPVQAVDLRGGDASQTIKIGQIGLSKLPPGRYLLTLVVTDPLADKKNPTLTRSIDFHIVD